MGVLGLERGTNGEMRDEIWVWVSFLYFFINI